MSTSPHQHRILITNDDGIHAPGIELLESIAREISDDVWVVAPDAERSGAGHSVSLTLPIRMRQLGPKRYQIGGTPTDCVLMALWQFMTDTPPTIILSGINSGANLAEDVSYSGTIAAAMEGTLLGIRSIALSQLRPPGGVVDFAPAARHAPDLIRRLIELDEWPTGSFINVNFPQCEAEEVTGIHLTNQGRRPPGAFSIDAREDPRNQSYFWVRISYPDAKALAGTDLAAVAENAISVTPIRMDFTDHDWQSRLAGALA
ncbi:MAG: 5'/3'-nucleotidase SurE [Gammaproteobacteria bacterium]